MKDGGRLMVIEWHWADEESQPGPPNTQRIEQDEAEKLIEDAGFTGAKQRRCRAVSLFGSSSEGDSRGSEVVIL